jgi:hypothetical protein
MPAIHAVLPDAQIIDRRSMNLQADAAARQAVEVTGRRRLLVPGTRLGMTDQMERRGTRSA